jgi:FMN phosphatase YigB (HAD superfamily)
MAKKSAERQENLAGREKTPNPLLKDWLNKHGVRSVLFDFDETLIDTASLFETQKRLYVTHLMTQLGGYNPEDLLARLGKIDDRYYETLGVNPKRWEQVVNSLAAELGEDHSELFLSGLPILMQIYQTKPQLMEGAIETLETFFAAGVNIGLVTHASPEWTNFKLDSLSLRKYFSQIVIVDENRHKNQEDWLTAIRQSGIEAGNTLVVGDNLTADIQSAAALGVRNLVWISQDPSIAVPDVITIDHIRQLIPTLISSLGRRRSLVG